MKFQFDPSIITKVLSKALYKNPMKVIAEYVANSWDADADIVKLILPEENTTDPLIIEDNGSGIDVVLFNRIAFDKTLETGVDSKKYKRRMIGKKGIGRWSGFAIASNIDYLSKDGKNETSFTFSREEIDKRKDLGTFEYEPEVKPSREPAGTIVKLFNFQENFDFPESNEVIKELLIEFAPSENFRLIVNGKEVKPEDIPGEHKLKLDDAPSICGKVKGFIAALPRKPTKRDPGVILRVNKRRVEGPSFFGAEREFDKWVLGRIVGEVDADELVDIVGLGYDSFDQQNPRYKALVGWLRLKIEDLAKTISQEKREDVEQRIKLQPEFQKRYRSLTPQRKSLVDKFVEIFAPQVARVSNSSEVMRVFGLLILRAVENLDLMSVLIRLEEAEDKDIKSLAEILMSWGVKEVATISSLFRYRRKVLKAFARFVNEKETLERDELHKVLEKNLWIIDDTYTMVSSDDSFKKIVEKLQSKFKNQASLNRPDLILKGLGEGSYLIIELKRPKEKITLDDMTQLVKYRYELQRLEPNAKEITAYLIGSSYDEEVRKEYPWGNDRRAFSLSLNELVQSANKRLEWLERNIENPEEVQSTEEFLKGFGIDTRREKTKTVTRS